MGKNNDIPLHQRAHFRRVREVITEIANYENMNIQNYDLFNMRVYDTMGVAIAGTNVSYNTDNGCSIFVEDNKYDIFEVPSKRNKKGSPYGEFIFFIHNTSFDYYMCGKMRVKLDEYSTKSRKTIVESAHYDNYGKYMITYEPNENNITKVEFGTEFGPGYNINQINYVFDSFNSRKHAFNTSQHKILRGLGLNILDPKKITDNRKVKKYGNNKRKKY